MFFIALYPASYPTDPFFPWVILLFFTFLPACVGLMLGAVLAKKVKGKIMITGSVVYWVIIFLYFAIGEQLRHILPFAAVLWSIFLVLFIDLAYAFRYALGKRKKQTLS